MQHRQTTIEPAWPRIRYYDRTAISQNTKKHVITIMHLTIHEKHKCCWATSTKNKRCWEKETMVAGRKKPQIPKNKKNDGRWKTKIDGPSPQKHQIPKSTKTTGRGGGGQ